MFIIKNNFAAVFSELPESCDKSTVYFKQCQSAGLSIFFKFTSTSLFTGGTLY